MKTTRDLDDGFYSCLEKLSVLQSTISTLQELSSLTRQLHNSFQGETGDLTTEMQERINNLGGFKAQHDRVDGLESRVMSSKDKAKRLSAKLEGARARVQTLEAQEAEWQATVTRMLEDCMCCSIDNPLTFYVRTHKFGLAHIWDRQCCVDCAVGISLLQDAYKPYRSGYTCKP